MAIELQGTLHYIGETQTFGASFRKRPFILRVPDKKDSKWDSYIPMAFTRDKVDLLDNYREGQEVLVGVDIKGRLAKDDDTKAYADIEAWKIYYPEQNHQRNSSSEPRQQRNRPADREFSRPAHKESYDREYPSRHEEPSEREKRYRESNDDPDF